MRTSRSRSIVLLLDCTYGGVFSQDITVRAAGQVNVLDSFPGGKSGSGRGRAVITASSTMQYAFAGDQLTDDHSRRPSFFTSALVDGLTTGDADRDRDGWVSLNELYDYIFDRVRVQHPDQTPSIAVDMQGELYLARRPVTAPVPLPSELQEVIDHPLANVRAGAVQQLARLQRGRHAGMAQAARLALERLAHDNSRTVAAAARLALERAAQDDSRTVVTAALEDVARDASVARTNVIDEPPSAEGNPRRVPQQSGDVSQHAERRRRWNAFLDGVAACVSFGLPVRSTPAGRTDTLQQAIQNVASVSRRRGNHVHGQQHHQHGAEQHPADEALGGNG